MASRSRLVLLAGLLLVQPPSIGAQNDLPASWLDRPLANWNTAGADVPRAPRPEEPAATLVGRCKLTLPQATSAEKAVASAGWVPYWNFDQQLVREDVEVVGGMAGADGMCRPTVYNLFVFVGGRFAGVLSPTPMTSRLDSSSGAVRLPLPAITADFARYRPGDALCCPSSRLTVRYQIERGASGPVVVPIEVRTTRP